MKNLSLTLWVIVCIVAPVYGIAQSQTAQSIPDEYANSGGVWYEDFYPTTNSVPVTISSLIGDGVNQHQIDTFFPLIDGEGSVFAALASYNYDDVEFGALSVGLAYGFVFDETIAARVRTHGDFSETGLGNHVEQFSMGIDLYTKWGFDIHGNAYYPGGERVSLTQGGQVIAEQLTQGQDVRARFDIPFLCDLINIPARGTLGVYTYDGAFQQGDMTGVLAGVHFFPLRGVSLGADYYEDKELYGDNWMFSGSVTFGSDDVLSPAGWGRGIKTAFSQRPSCQQEGSENYLKSRLLSSGAQTRKVRATVQKSVTTGGGGGGAPPVIVP